MTYHDQYSSAALSTRVMNIVEFPKVLRRQGSLRSPRGRLVASLWTSQCSNGFQTCFSSAASAFENIEFKLIFIVLKRKNFSVSLKGFTCVSLICREMTSALGRNYKHKAWDLATERFTRRTETLTDLKSGSDKTAATLAVKLITKGGFIRASGSKELYLQRQLQ